MITAQQIRDTQLAKKKQDEERLIYEAKQNAERLKIAKEAALKQLPAILDIIGTEISEAVRFYSKNSLYYRCLPWMNVGLIQNELVHELVGAGYTVKFENVTPIVGGDPESGEGGMKSGPDQYAIEISWE